MLARILIGLVGSSLAAAAAARLGSLTPGGAWTAILVGTTITGAGYGWAALLLVFFVTSSLFSRLSAEDTPPRLIVEKSSRRDALQVLANGGVPAISATLFLVSADVRWAVPFAASLAAATADTWATEIGATSSAPPIHIFSRQRALPGTSGAVSARGTIGAVAGAILIAAAGWLLIRRDIGVAIAVTTAGFAGALLDSILGATVQERRRCPVCRRQTEQREHAMCHTPTFHCGGILGLNNDAVNVLACLGAASFSLGIAMVLEASF